MHLRDFLSSEGLALALVNALPDALLVVDANGNIAAVNATALELFGYEELELLGQPVELLIPERFHASHLEARRHFVEQPSQRSMAQGRELWARRRDGRELSVQIALSPVTQPQGPLVLVALRETPEYVRALQLETVLRMLPDPVAIRVGEVFAYVNPAWLRVLGYDNPGELLGARVIDSVHPDDHGAGAERLISSGTEGTGEVIELRMLAKDGSVIPLDFPPSLALHYHGRPARLVVAHDRREEKRMAAAFAKRERLATVGTLAAGVGHELNNPLQSVTMSLELLRDELRGVAGGSPSSLYRELLDMTGDALRGAERIRKIVTGLHTFSRGEREEQSLLDPRAVLELSINLAQNELRHRARVEQHFEPAPLVLADESKLAQVFINLLINAVQAMPDRPTDQNVVRLATRSDEQGRAIIEISDNGAGMAPTVRARIFEPFFTTKPVGRGTGLGLAISYNIVTSLGGQVECESEPGVGTTIRIVLPRAPVAAPYSGPRPVEPTFQGARILIVEDEATVARLLERVLSHEHVVDLAADGMEALSRLSAHDYDLVLCDLMMPRMNGMELFERVTREHAELADRFVFMTGGATRPEVQDFLDSVPNEKLHKPFSIPAVKSLIGRLARERRWSAASSRAEAPVPRRR